jgi:hypothetical protein
MLEIHIGGDLTQPTLDVLKKLERYLAAGDLCLSQFLSVLRAILEQFPVGC